MLINKEVSLQEKTAVLTLNSFPAFRGLYLFQVEAEERGGNVTLVGREELTAGIAALSLFSPSSACLCRVPTQTKLG